MADPYSLESLPPGKALDPNALAPVPGDFASVDYVLGVTGHPDDATLPINAWVEPEAGGGGHAVGAYWVARNGAVDLDTIISATVRVVAQFDGEITDAYVVTAGGSGSCTIGVKKCAFADAYGSLADITDGNDVVLSSATKLHDSTLTDWDPLTVAAGDVFEFELKSTATFTYIAITLTY